MTTQVPVLFTYQTPLDNPPIGANFVNIVNGHLSLDSGNTTPASIGIGIGSPPYDPTGAPILTGPQRFLGFGVNIDFGAFYGALYWNGSAEVYNTSTQATIGTWLDNLVNLGVRVVRIHDLDIGLSANLFCSTTGPQTTTRTLDPVSMDLLGWFFNQCKTRNIRVIITMHFGRQLINATDTPPVSSPSFTECSTSASPYTGLTGMMHPWFWYDTGLQYLQTEYIQNVLTYVNPYTSIALGRDPTLLAVILQNETSLSTNVPATGYNGSLYPVLQSMWTASTQAWAAANGVTWSTMNAVQFNEWAIQLETQVLQAQATFARGYTSALIIANTFYGNAPYGIVKSMYDSGDIMDFHIYSRSTLTDPDALLAPPIGNPGGLRTGFSACAAGCTFNKPTICTEWTPVAQANPNMRNPTNDTRVPDSERSQAIAAVVNAAIEQDLDIICLYSYLRNPVNYDLSVWTPGVYDFIDDAVFLNGIRAAIAAFHDIDNRPTSTTLVTLSPQDYYGSMGGSYNPPVSPFNDPDLYGISQTTKIQMFFGTVLPTLIGQGFSVPHITRSTVAVFTMPDFAQ